MSKCTCEGTYAVTFCKDCGIGMDTQARALAKVDEAIKAYEGYNSNLMPFLRALRKAIERHKDGVMEWRGVCLCGDRFPCPELTEIAKEMGI